ncbi:MAG: right-handed parallel beta-helix repeat-containing protein [Candidatus Eisenbacteria bacterium]|nr:right-handed parallel beta-helix repeat-containing protein [Candidatus Eisenbacteria bacterium]
MTGWDLIFTHQGATSTAMRRRARSRLAFAFAASVASGAPVGAPLDAPSREFASAVRTPRKLFALTLALPFLTLLLLALILASVEPAAASTFTVSNTSNTGVGSLRRAINDANGDVSEPHTIEFALSTGDPNYSGGIWTIPVASGLPYLSRAITIDGTTQSGYAGTPVIEIDGSATSGETAIGISANDCEIRGLTINRFASGVLISLESDGNVIAGNYLGTNSAGTSGVSSSSDAFYVAGANNTIGGTGSSDGNVIAGTYEAVFIEGVGSTGNVIQGNLIGWDAAGTTILGTGASAVYLYDGVSGTLIGGTETNAPNRIAGTTFNAIALDATAGSGNAIVSNSIAQNGDLAIDISDNGVTENDSGDLDSGPNGKLNFPVLTSAVESGGTVYVDYTLDVPAGTYRIEFFANPSGADPSGNGEGEVFAGADSVSHGGTGSTAFSHSFSGSAGDILTATTIAYSGSTFGSTSEFSDTRTAVAGTLYSIAGTVFEDVNYGGGSGADLTAANARAGGYTIERGGVTVELYDTSLEYVTTTTTAANGSYSFAGLTPARYTVRVVNSTVTSVRTGSDGSEVAVQTFRADGWGESSGDGAKTVGGEEPSSVDAGANSGSDTLLDLQAPAGVTTQSIVTADASSGDVSDVDFGFNFDTVVNTNDSGQGSLRQFILNANLLTDQASLAQAGLTSGAETSVFMIPSDADPLGRSADPNYDGTGNGEFTIQPLSALTGLIDPMRIDASTQTANIGDTNASGPEVELDGSGAGGGAGGLYFDAAGGSHVIVGLVINRFDSNAILVDNSDGNTFLGNYLGVDVTGLVDRGNGGSGLRVVGGSSGNVIGGSTAAERNVISGNGNYGIEFWDAGTTGNVVQGNYIGVGSDGTTALGNDNSGIMFGGGAATNTLGGTGSGEGNIIANSGFTGIEMLGVTTIENALLGNAVFGNTSIGIDLSEDGVTGNDPDDDDSGPNDLRNFPAITSATESGGTVTVDFTLDLGATLAGDYRIEFFTNPNGVDATNGEGEAFASAVTVSHGGTGSESFSHSFSGSAGDVLTATTTDSIPAGGYGNTSEFSAWYTVTALPAYSITGRVFEDVDFAGTASAYDGGVADALLDSVDVELYDADDSDAFLASTATGRSATGTFTFTGIPDGNYEVRVRSATIGDTDSPPRGGLNGTVPGTWPYPLPEMTWGSGSASYGGQSATADDTDTGDDAGPGDTYVSVTVSGGNVTGVDFGFAYNLIVRTADDGVADSARSDQGSLRQFLKNANAIGSANGTTANSSEFRMQEVANQSSGLDSWWRIVPLAALPALSDDGTTLDGSTLGANLGTDSNSLGPEVEIHGNALAATGLSLQADGVTVREIVVNGFTGTGIAVTGASATNNSIFGCYVGTDALGASASSNLDFGVWVTSSATGTVIGGSGAGEGNVVSGNGSNATEAGISVGTSTADVTILGNKIGTDRTGTAKIANMGPGIKMSAGDGITIGGSAPGEANVISGNGARGIDITDFAKNVTILGNHIGVGVTGSETTLGNGNDGIYVANFNDPSNIVIGGLGAGEANLIAENGSDGVVSVRSGAGDEVLGNTVRDNSGYGLDSSTNGLLVAGNYFVDNASGVILSDDTSGPSANDNDFLHNTVHGALSGPGITVAGLGANLRNNIVTGNATYGIYVSTGTMTESHNNVTDASTNPSNGSGRSNVSLDATDLNVDPLFVDSGNGDLSLTECTSPCINVGLDLGGSQPDMNGSDGGLYNGLAPDQGAFETSCTGLTLGITKRAFLPDGTPIAHGAVLPRGADVLYLLYITNPGPARTDISLQDVLDPAFEYQSGSIRVDSSASACIAGSCTTTEEQSIFTAAKAASAGTDAVDGDAVSYTAGTKTIDAGDESAANLQLDIPANSALGLLFEVKVR